MAVRTARAGSKNHAAAAADLVERLDQLRLDNDWSYRELAEAMQRAGVGLSSATLHQLLTERSLQPFDRTLHKIRLYLDTVDEKPRRKRATA